jgi:hypothetical protein
MKYHFAAAMLFCAVLPLCAASADNAKTEEAVRARVRQYYDFLNAGQFRSAEGLVCQASLEYYSSQAKHSPLAVKIGAVKLSPDQKSAEVELVVDDNVSFGNFSKRISLPQTLTWVLEKKHWCVQFVPPSGELKTPFGKVKMGGTAGAGDAAPMAPPAPVNLSELSHHLDFSKPALKIIPDEDGTDSLTIRNGMTGPVEFAVDCPRVAGLTCSLEPKMLVTGQSAKLEVRFKHGTEDLPAHAAVLLTVSPFAMTHSVPILP